MRALKFGAVGIANTALDIALFSALTLAAHFPAVGANVISYSAGIGLSFAVNRAWTFRDHNQGRAWIQLTLFVVGNLTGLALSTAVIGLLARSAGPLLAKAVSVCATFAWNYAFSNLVVFQRS